MSSKKTRETLSKSQSRLSSMGSTSEERPVAIMGDFAIGL